ncbi:MAG: hypothetical protein QM714_00595 [Nocardioides sp.]|uniref:hypothetical protein n=1 Tax=Nocardioides sp. TaxID=35761 RepID=UPI0039E37942
MTDQHPIQVVRADDPERFMATDELVWSGEPSSLPVAAGRAGRRGDSHPHHRSRRGRPACHRPGRGWLGAINLVARHRAGVLVEHRSDVVAELDRALRTALAPAPCPIF